MKLKGIDVYGMEKHQAMQDAGCHLDRLHSHVFWIPLKAAEDPDMVRIVPFNWNGRPAWHEPWSVVLHWEAPDGP